MANVETINVSGVTYYRLKLGAYQNQANAAADCDKLKQRQINCIVSHYTQQPLK
ncbi:SPOR domain-containing protein [Pseudoalteromonas tetraodonis]|uniref:SPOR domain-containing protein n=1 Tax=Pseudoalteromonas sp. 2CM28B TaxID=2929851 RepID=UPI0009F59686